MVSTTLIVPFASRNARAGWSGMSSFVHLFADQSNGIVSGAIWRTSGSPNTKAAAESAGSRKAVSDEAEASGAREPGGPDAGRLASLHWERLQARSNPALSRPTT